jgi:hypothetical protein
LRKSTGRARRQSSSTPKQRVFSVSGFGCSAWFENLVITTPQDHHPESVLKISKVAKLLCRRRWRSKVDQGRLSERATGPNKTELLYGIPANSGGRLACYTFGTMNAQIER